MQKLHRDIALMLAHLDTGADQVTRYGDTLNVEGSPLGPAGIDVCLPAALRRTRPLFDFLASRGTFERWNPNAIILTQRWYGQQKALLRRIPSWSLPCAVA